MAIEIKRLRTWFAGAAVTLLVIVAGFYVYGRIRAYRAVEQIPEKLGVDVQQSTAGFTLSKSEGGRTLFKVHATRAVQFREGGRAELHDVSIVVYGRESDRFDQIYGSQFQYDPSSGDITAQGEVQIDLQGNAQGPGHPDQAVPPELRNPIHLKTSGLIFNQKTGIAATKEEIDFRAPQASGSAIGAVYNAQAKTLTLDSEVRIESVQGVTIRARHGVITAEPRQAVLTAVTMLRPQGKMEASKLTLFFRPDNNIDRIVATGEVHADFQKTNPMSVSAPQAEFVMGEKDALRTAVVSGGVNFEQGGASPLHGTAGKATVEFGPKNSIASVIAAEGFKLVETQKATPGQQAQEVEMDSGGANLRFRQSRLDSGETSGEAQIVIRPEQGHGQGDTVVTATRFELGFDADSGRLKTLHGAPEARIVSHNPNQPDRVSTSRELNVAFDPKGEGITWIKQAGEVHYVEGQRKAAAEEATFRPGTGELVLEGSPRFSDQGTTTTARILRLNQRTGEATAAGDVKTTYSDMKPQTGGAMLASGDPLHVTASNMKAQRATTVASYTGSARLWQGASLVDAAKITFDRGQRTVAARAGAGARVTTAFLQTESSGKTIPVKVTAAALNYSDAQRTAKFEDGVVLRSGQTTMTARQVTVFLLPAGQPGGLPTKAGMERGSGAGAPAGASQVDRIVAEGGVIIREPERKATGERLVYTASDGKYLMTGGPPSIFDAERGTIRGDSLTFYSHDDRVLVSSAHTSRTVTQTRIVK